MLCFNLNQIFRKVVQDFATVFGDQDQVFDSYANATRDIDARFYGEAHAWFQDFFVGEGDIAKLVDFQSDIVSGTMGEVLAIALVLRCSLWLRGLRRRILHPGLQLRFRGGWLL